MPRDARTELAGGIHHVWQRGNRRQAIFIDDDDCRTFLRLLSETSRKRGWRLLAYCLMHNHFHLAVETPGETLGLGMRDLCSRYAQLFNERHETGGGHLFQARFGSKLVQTDEQLAQLLRYIACNPVQAGLCATPGQWPWSSHRAVLHRRRDSVVDSERVLDLLAALGGVSRDSYAALFEPDGPLAHLPADMSPWALRPTLDEILRCADIASALRRARRHGYGAAEVSEHLGISQATLWRRVREKGSVPL